MALAIPFALQQQSRKRLVKAIKTHIIKALQQQPQETIPQVSSSVDESSEHQDVRWYKRNCQADKVCGT